MDKTLCLTMICKNESATILRALISALPHIDYWVICDTGSTDGTQKIIKDFMNQEGIPGDLHQVPWVDFGSNRTEALKLARGKADYRLILDADQVMHASAPFKHLLTEGAYETRYTGDLDYTGIRLLSDKYEFYYVGVTHEYCTSDGWRGTSILNEVTISDFPVGANRTGKSERDATLLFGGLLKEPTNSRYAFYLARSLYDAGNFELAAYWFQKRIDLGGWDEETYLAMLELGRMYIILKKPLADVISALTRALEFRPSRLEALYELVKYYRMQGHLETAYLLAHSRGIKPPYSSDRLFVERPVYTFWFSFEYWLLCDLLGYKEEKEKVTAYLLSVPLPHHVLDAIHHRP